MDSYRLLRLSQTEALRLEVMRRIVEQLQDTPYVLKGGSALVFTRDLDRLTNDLDFDSSKPLNLEGRIRKGLEIAGVELISLKAVKNTQTTQRYKVHFRNRINDQDELLKVEASFRQAPGAEMVESIKGIRTYKIGHLFDQKFAATQGRTEARDLYDLAHLVKNHGEQLSGPQINQIDQFSRNIEDLISRYAQSFELDKELASKSSIRDTVITLREAVGTQLQLGMSTGPAREDIEPQSLESDVEFFQDLVSIVKTQLSEQIRVDEIKAGIRSSMYYKSALQEGANGPLLEADIMRRAEIDLAVEKYGDQSLETDQRQSQGPKL